MNTNHVITQICIVVHDVKTVNANWSKVLGLPEAEIVTLFSGGVLHYTKDGEPIEYTDCKVAKYELDNFIIELMQPAESPNPWRAHLDKYGQSAFHLCIFVNERKIFQQTLGEIGVRLPYHIGYFPGGSYSYVDSKEALGIELSVNHHDGDTTLYEAMSNGTAVPFEELK